MFSFLLLTKIIFLVFCLLPAWHITFRFNNLVNGIISFRLMIGNNIDVTTSNPCLFIYSQEHLLQMWLQLRQWYTAKMHWICQKQYADIILIVGLFNLFIFP